MIYSKVEQFVVDSFTSAGKINQLPHFERTVHWLKILKPDADETLLIAAISHDIERAFRKEDMTSKKKLGFDKPEFYRTHEERGAEIIAEFLRKQCAKKELVERVKQIVSRHEEGGDPDTDTLRDADSVSFFETNIDRFLKKIPEDGKENIRAKLDWMFKRIENSHARKIAKKLYQDAIQRLDAS